VLNLRRPQKLAELDRPQRRKRRWGIVGLGALELQHVERQVLAGVGSNARVERQPVLVVFDGAAAALDAGDALDGLNDG
jgi:hypothetical protein